MKKIITILSLAVGLSFLTSTITYAAEEKTVCVDVKDKEGKPVKDKNGKVKQSCKTIKVHKKLEGTEIPPAKK